LADVVFYVGSIAAGIQSAGVAGTLFSTLQSAAMAGYGVTATTSLFAGVGAATGGAVGAAARAAAKGPSDAKDDGRTDNDGSPPELKTNRVRIFSNKRKG
jgi:hypothetical protein